MNLRRILPRVLVCALGVTALTSARAGTFRFSGNFAADNSTYEVSIDTLTQQSFSLSTTSFSQGGFVPVLTLFDGMGNFVASGGDGTSDASIAQTLDAGQYDLVLTEFPNYLSADPSKGFQFAGSPTATGDVCGVAGGMFLDAAMAPCTQLGSNFALLVDSPGSATVTPVASTPEPSSLLLMLAPATGLLWTRRRQNA